MGAANWLKLFGAKTRLRGCTRIQNVRKRVSRQADIGQVCNFFGEVLAGSVVGVYTLGDDILSLTFHEHQKLISNDLVKEVVESAFVDLVNAVGVDINESVRDSRLAQTLKYVGLGPRKASGMLRNIAQNWGLC